MGQASKHLREIKDRLNKSKNKITKLVATEAVNFYKKSFTDGGFTDTSLVKWKEPKRREVFSEVGKTKVYKYDDYSSWWKGKGSVTQYTKADRTRAILVKSGNLRRSIRYVVISSGRVRITADLAYAEAHNEGYKSIPKRQFIGKSETLNKKIDKIILAEIVTILKPQSPKPKINI